MARVPNADATTTNMGAVIMDELLFDVGESLSPQLQWMDRHGVKIEYITKRKVYEASTEKDRDVTAEHANYDECLYQLALIHGL